MYLVLALVFFALCMAAGGVGGFIGLLLMVIAQFFLRKHNEKNSD